MWYSEGETTPYHTYCHNTDGGSGGGCAVRESTTHTATIQDGGSGGGGAVRESVWSTQ